MALPGEVPPVVRALTDLLERCRRWPPAVADAVLAAAVAGVTIVAVAVQSSTDDEPMTVYGAVLLAAQLETLQQVVATGLRRLGGR